MLPTGRESQCVRFISGFRFLGRPAADPVFRGRAAFHLFEDMGKMGGGDESYRFTDLRDLLPGAGQQFLGPLAADIVMVSQGSIPDMLLEDSQEIIPLTNRLSAIF